MKKIAVALTLSVLGMFSSVAQADWSEWDRIETMRTSRFSYDEGKTVITLRNTSPGFVCPNGDFFIRKDSSGKESQFPILLAAVQSGRQISIGYSIEPLFGAGCDVYSIRIR